MYKLYDIDALIRATSYYEPEPDDNIIEDFNEFMRYLNDTKIFEVPLDKKISQLDQTKVQDYLEQFKWLYLLCWLRDRFLWIARGIIAHTEHFSVSSNSAVKANSVASSNL